MERKPRAITISSYEDIDSIVTTELKIPDVPENYVLIRTEFASLNPADELIHDPKWPFKFEQSTFGFQGSGTVVLSGGGVLANSLVNKRVAFIVYGPHSIGSFSEYSLTQAKYVFPIGDAFSLEQAAIFFNAVMTELMVTKILKQNHKAAIQNAAASSVGKQLIRYCKYLGITLINIVSREDQIEILKAMGAKHVISTSEEN